MDARTRKFSKALGGCWQGLIERFCPRAMELPKCGHIYKAQRKLHSVDIEIMRGAEWKTAWDS